MNWAAVRMGLQLLRLQAQHVLLRHRRRLQVVLLLLVLRTAWRPLLRHYVRRLHYALTAETPRLHFQPTPTNQRLLSQCPTITRLKYYPPWHLFNGHLQTVQLSRESPLSFPRVLYERQTLDMPDGGIVSLDWALPPDSTTSKIPRVSAIDSSTPTMLILPGLTGGSSEFYIRCVVHLMNAQGWQVAVLNARGCERTPVKTPQLFCCAYTSDVRHVLNLFRDKYDFVAHSALVAVGFSMGSNVLVKYLGEDQQLAKLTVTAAVSVGNPFDLVACASHLKSTAFYRATYDKALNGNLQQLFFIKSNAHEAFKNDTRISIEDVRNAQTLTEFDDRLTRRIFDYDSVHAYYADASSSTKIKNVHVTLLCLNAEDDPISVATSLPYAVINTNPHVMLCVTKAGGHLAFYEDVVEEENNPKEENTRVRAWSARVIAEFAASVLTSQQQQQ